MEVYRVAKKLRELIISHDKAVKQINLLDIKISEMNQRMSNLTDPVDPVFIMYSLLDQRKSIVEFIRDMYHIYRLIKWEQIQMIVSCLWEGMVPRDINHILAFALMEYTDGLTRDEDVNSLVLEEDMMVDGRLI